MIDNALRAFAEGFKGSLLLWKEIILALFSVVTVLVAFVNAPRVSEFKMPRRSR